MLVVVIVLLLRCETVWLVLTVLGAKGMKLCLEACGDASHT